MNTMTVGTQNAALGNFGLNVGPLASNGFTYAEGFLRWVKVIKVKGRRMLGVPTQFTPLVHFNLIYNGLSFISLPFLVGPVAVGAVGPAALGWGQAFRARPGSSSLYSVSIAQRPPSIAGRTAPLRAALSLFVHKFIFGHEGITPVSSNNSNPNYWIDMIDTPDNVEWDDFFAAFTRMVS